MTNSTFKLPPPPEPPGWGEDELTKFLEHTRQNQRATFANKRDAMAKLVNSDAQFMKFTKVGWLNPESEVAAMLFLRCIGAYRAACGLAMAGQAADAYVQCRAVLEYAGYAVHVDRNPALARLWLDRHEDEAGMKASKKAFIGNISFSYSASGVDRSSTILRSKSSLIFRSSGRLRIASSRLTSGLNDFSISI
jgi:hypothetical protein